MGVFRRAKAKPSNGQRGFLKVNQQKKVQDDDSIGDALAAEDQFDLYIPIKRPTSILKKRSFDLVHGRRCMELQGDRSRKKAPTQSNDVIETSSSFSSLTTPSMSIKPTEPNPQTTKSRKDKTTIKSNRHPSSPAAGKPNCFNPCCGRSEKTQKTVNTNDNNSIAACRHKPKKEEPPKKQQQQPVSCWTSFCGIRTDTYISDDVAASIILKKPRSMRKENSLFDTLQDEEPETDARDGLMQTDTQTEAGIDTAIAIVEMDSMMGEQPSAATNGSKWKVRFPSVPLPKMRSIPKIRSFRIGKKKKKPVYVQPYELE